MMVYKAICYSSFSEIKPGYGGVIHGWEMGSGSVKFHKDDIIFVIKELEESFICISKNLKFIRPLKGYFKGGDEAQLFEKIKC